MNREELTMKNDGPMWYEKTIDRLIEQRNQAWREHEETLWRESVMWQELAKMDGDLDELTQRMNRRHHEVERRLAENET